MGEAVPPFHHLDAAAPHQLVGRARMHLAAVEDDRALGHLAALGRQQIGDRLQRGRLAGAVRAEQRHDLALGHVERHALEHEDDVVVDDLDVVDRRGSARRGRLTDGCRWRKAAALPPPPARCDRFGRDRHQLVAGSPAVIFFSAAYLAAASLTIGAITLSSLVYQSDVIFQFLPSQVWMRPVRAPS